jgi:protein gp37
MTTVESADYIWRIVEILKVPAVVHGVSYEPALGPVDWERWLGDIQPGEAGLRCGITWLISGTESGASARPADLQWFRDARDKCREAGAAFFMKQLTEKG